MTLNVHLGLKKIGTRTLDCKHFELSRCPILTLSSGELGLAAFAHILSDKRTQGIPLILETPMHDNEIVWQTEISVLHNLAGVVADQGVLEEGVRSIKGVSQGVEKKATKSSGKKKKENLADQANPDFSG